MSLARTLVDTVARALAGTLLAAAAGAEPMLCPATSADSYPADLWEAEHFDSGTCTPLDELQWLPDAPEDTGHVLCHYSPDHSRSIHHPVLRGRFRVLRPTQPGWMRASQSEDWLLCSGATMTRFAPDKCPFVPAQPLPRLHPRQARGPAVPLQRPRRAGFSAAVRSRP